ncbi:MAG TPA: hypothetical protein DCY46_06855 [Lactobacillus sp.]|nr:hypothetical protein [Lactobacillus sp.]
MPHTMQAMLINHYGQKQLDRVLVPIPTPGPSDVLVAIHAASINPIDFKTRDGAVRMLLKYQMPLILGSDFAGEIVQVGSRVTRFKIGDAVYGRPRKSRIGTFAEYLAVDQADIAQMPQNLSYPEAAALPLVGLTTYQAFHDMLQLQPNQKILIQAGSGGIGTFAIQLAKLMGAYAATTTSGTNRALVTDLGADQVIDYHQENFTDVLHDYDAVYDTLGGDNLLQAFKIVKPGGAVVSLSGLPDGKFARADGLPLWKQALFSLATRAIRKREKQYHVAYRFLFMKPSGEQLALITQLVEVGEIRPVIDEIVPFADFQQAMDHSEAGHARGKIVVKMQ